MKETEFKRVSLDMLEISDVKIREIYEDHDKYKDLCRSVATHGVMEAILCRPSPINPGKLQIADGNNRANAAKLAKLKNVPVKVADLTDEEMMAMQYILNAHRIPTKPKDELNHLKKFIANHETMPHKKVADAISKLKYDRDKVDPYFA